MIFVKASHKKIKIKENRCLVDEHMNDFFLTLIRLIIFDCVSLFELEIRTYSKTIIRFIQRAHIKNAISNDQK